MVKTAEEIKEYQKLYFQKNKQKLYEKRKEQMKDWKEKNKDYWKQYYKQYYENNKIKYKTIIQKSPFKDRQVANHKNYLKYKDIRKKYYLTYIKNNRNVYRKSINKWHRNKRKGFICAIEREFTEEASEKMLTELCDHYFDCIKDTYYNWFIQKDHYV